MTQIEIYCANCGGRTSTQQAWIHRGSNTRLCGSECHLEMEYRYAAHVLGKPTDRATVMEHVEKQRRGAVAGAAPAKEGQ